MEKKFISLEEYIRRRREKYTDEEIDAYFRSPEYRKKYYEKNKERIAEKHKEYYEENKEVLKQYQQQYQENNKDKIAERKKEYYENNKKKILEKRKDNKDMIKEKASQKVTCSVCGKEIRKDGLKRHQESKKCLKIKNNA